MSKQFDMDNHTPEEALSFLTTMALSAPASGTVADAVIVHNAITEAVNTITNVIEKNKPKKE